MGFSAGERDLSLVAKGQDVVAKDILFAVMLVHASVLHVVHQIVLIKNPGASFIRVQTPATVTRRIYIMNQIVADDSAFGWTQRIHPAHVAEHFIAEMMQVVVFNSVALGGALIVTPTPAH